MSFEVTQVPASAGRPRYHQYSDDTIRELIDQLNALNSGEGIKLGEYAEEGVARGQARAAQRQLAAFGVTVGTSVWETDDDGNSRFVSAIHPTTRQDSRDVTHTERRFHDEPIQGPDRRQTGEGAATDQPTRAPAAATPQVDEPGGEDATTGPQAGQGSVQATQE